MAEEKELIIKINFSQSIEKKVKELTKFQKEVEKVKQKLKDLDTLKKISKEISINIRNEDVKAEMLKIEYKLSALKNKFQKPINMLVKAKDTASDALKRVKSAASKLGGNPIAVGIKESAYNGLVKIGAMSEIVKKRLDPLKQSIAPVVAWKEHNSEKIQLKIQSIKDKIASIKDKVPTPVIKVKDMATSALKKIGSGMKVLGGVALAGVQGAAGLIGGGIKGAMQLEQQELSLQHSIKTSSKGMSNGEANKEAQKYTGWLKQSANVTPFSTSEVMSAGSKAIKASGGDSKEAQKLVKLAQNMSALNQGKSLEDAMNALSELKNGNADSLSEFGLDIKPEDLDKAGGIQNIIDNQLEPLFAGGVDKLNDTATGKLETIKGSLQTIMSDVGKNILDKFKGPLDSVMNFILEKQPQITQAITSIFDVFAGIVGNLKPFIEPLFQTLVSAGQQLMPVFKSVGETLGSFFMSLIEYGAPVISTFVQLVTPLIMSLWNNILQPMFAWLQEQLPLISSFLQTAMEWIAPKLETIIQFVSRLGGIFQTIWPVIVGVVQIAWSLLEPILDYIWGGIEKLGGIFLTTFEIISDAVSKAWGIVGPILKRIAELAGTAIGKIGEFLGISGGDKKSGSGSKGAVDNKSKSPFTPKHAAGIRRVPYDNYPALLHRGERVVPARDNRGENNKGVNLNVSQLVVREEADIDRIASVLARKITEASFNSA